MKLIFASCVLMLRSRLLYTYGLYMTSIYHILYTYTSSEYWELGSSLVEDLIHCRGARSALVFPERQPTVAKIFLLMEDLI